MSESNRFATLILAVGTVVLLGAILIGELMGARVFSKIAHDPGTGLLLVTPEPSASAGPFGPDWKRSEALTAVPAPDFPDPRIPPKPLPTLAPRPTPTAAPATATPNPNIPIWRQQPLPSATPSSLPSAPSSAAGTATSAALAPSAPPARPARSA